MRHAFIQRVGLTRFFFVGACMASARNRVDVGDLAAFPSSTRRFGKWLCGLMYSVFRWSVLAIFHFCILLYFSFWSQVCLSKFRICVFLGRMGYNCADPELIHTQYCTFSFTQLWLTNMLYYCFNRNCSFSQLSFRDCLGKKLIKLKVIELEITYVSNKWTSHIYDVIIVVFLPSAKIWLV